MIDSLFLFQALKKSIEPTEEWKPADKKVARTYRQTYGNGGAYAYQYPAQILSYPADAVPLNTVNGNTHADGGNPPPVYAATTAPLTEEPEKVPLTVNGDNAV